MRIIFFGSDDFALRHLETLHDAGYDVIACVTQPDRPKGRGMKVAVSPIKAFALGHQIPLFQPDKILGNDFRQSLVEFAADIFIVIAYGKILPQSILDIPQKYAINVHASLLPKYRGAAPINWVIINGEKETGVTVMKMNARMDAGDIIAQAGIDIAKNDTAVTLRAKLMENGAILLTETLKKIAQGKEKMVPQNHQAATIASKLTKEMGRINWNEPAEKINSLVRGLLPWPGAYTFYEGKILKILEAEALKEKVAPPGTIAAVDKDGFVVGAGEGSLLVKKVHFEASKPMDAASFCRGHQLKTGYRFEKIA